jgi:L-rhamnose-H+ transport protein
VFLALLTGVLGGAINVGFALSQGILRRAETIGNSPTTSTYAVWVILLAAGFLPNAVYCSYLLRKEGTTKGFVAPDMSGDFLRTFLMAAMWILGTTLYGIATTFLGRYGTSLGYLSYGSCSIIFASVLGWKAGEWKGASPAVLRAFWKAMVIILASVVVLGLTA